MTDLTVTVQGKDMIIHVNRQHIAMNAKDGGNRPVYTIKDNGVTIYARRWSCKGEVLGEYNGTQLRCGARAWIEIAQGSVVTLYDAMTFQDAREAA